MAPSKTEVNASSRARLLLEQARPSRALVLQQLFNGGARSRADLARHTGLTRVTVGEIVNDLLEYGLVHEIGTKPGSRPGKPATLVELDHTSVSIASLDLSRDDKFVAAIVNLNGEIVFRTETPLADATGDTAVEKVLVLVAALIDAAPAPLIGIGIGTPGIVDDGGTIIEAPNLGWFGISLAERIQRAFNYPVFVVNDANAAVVGVRMFGKESSKNIMVIRLEHGVGAGLVVGGELVQGEQFAAGEIGHVVIDELGAPCTCGRNGCLETILAARQIRRRIAEVPADQRNEVLADAGRALGQSLSMVVAALNLDLIVLSGPSDLIEGPLTEALEHTIRSHTLPVISGDLTVRTPYAGEDLVLMGATALVLNHTLGVA